MIKYGECHITIDPTLDAKSVRRRMGEVHMNILSGMSAGLPPIKLVIKGGNIARVAELLSLCQQPDEALAEMARGSVLADEFKGMTDVETAEEMRASFFAELKEMAGE